MDHDGADGKTMTISEFARRSGLSHKALRLYDESGLLQPADVDPANGYRRYDEAQFARARRISLLRQLDMPLAKIAEFLVVDERDAVRLLDRWWVGQEASMQAKRGSLEFLRAQLEHAGDGIDPRYEVQLREVPETKVATIRCEVTQQELIGVTNDAESRIKEHLAASGAVLGTETWFIYHDVMSPDSEATVEVCVEFAGTVEPVGPIAIRVEATHTEAYCTIARDECVFPRIMAAYDVVDAWVRTSGLPTAGPVREAYFAAWAEIGGGDPFAHIAQPVRTGNSRLV